MGRLDEILKKAVDFFKKGSQEGDSKFKRPVWKRLNTLVMVAAAGALFMILSNVFSTTSGLELLPQPTDLVNNQTEESAVIQGQSEIANLEKVLAAKLEEVLTQIEGVGRVKVTVNLASTTEKDLAVNTSTTEKNTLEKDKSGGNRTISEINENGQIVLVRESQGSKELPVVVKEISPEVRGVIVVAAGADNSAIKMDLMNAVQVYLDVPLYRVMVLPLERG